MITDTHLEYFEAKMMLAYVMYGERSVAEAEGLGAENGGCVMMIRSAFKMLIDYVFAPFLLCTYYFCFLTPIIIFGCY